MTDTHGPIEIRVPADPHLSRVLRLASSGVASLSEFTVDEIEDIKVAVSEILLALIEHGDGQPVDIRLHTDARRFLIEASTDTAEFDTAHPNLVMCDTVLSGVCSTHEIELADGRASIRASVAHLDSATG
jgi:anti-sigma regulatory factor (Ser/Thr protein kinase)